MTSDYLLRLVSTQRTTSANRHLGGILAFIAGATNAGGFLAIHRYTSHMSGVVSGIADDLATGGYHFAAAGLAMLLSFISGAACAAVVVNWAKRRAMHGSYALVLVIEASLLLLFALQGARLEAAPHLLVPATVLLLCFIMGLHNAFMTKISESEIRATHLTGLVTDLGVEIGRLAYWRRAGDALRGRSARASRDKLVLHAIVLSLFFCGGVFGALAFKRFGFLATLPIAILLLVLAVPALRLDWQRPQNAWPESMADSKL